MFYSASFTTWIISTDVYSLTLCPVVCFLLRWIGTMILYTYHKGHFDCNGRGVLHTYLVGLLVVLGLIILSLCAIVYVSAQGKSLVFTFKKSLQTCENK